MESKNHVIKINEKSFPYIKVESEVFIPIRPLCQALGLSPKWHTESIKKDKILGDVSCVHGIHDTTGRVQNMICLPEMFIYGWLFSIQETNTMSNETKANLQAYKVECYKALFFHFHGKLITRRKKLEERLVNQQSIQELQDQLEQELKKSPTYEAIRKLKAQNASIAKELKQLDNEVATGQLSLFEGKEGSHD